MTVYPEAIDSDDNIIRVDDNITELGGEAINQLRDAVFAIEGELGTRLSGSMGSFSERINVSLHANGTLKESALTAIGLVTLPITNSQIASNAGIQESKLNLAHGTSDLYTLITANRMFLDAVNAFLNVTSADFFNHLTGALHLKDNTISARHVASHIDLNTTPNDLRDPLFIWNGLSDKNGNQRSAANVASALFQINTDLVNHENATSNAHVATAISIDTSNFSEIPHTANTLQKALDYIDNAEELNLGEHRASQHSNGISRIVHSQSVNFDGYGYLNIIPDTLVNTYLVNPPANSFVDDNSVGDDIIKFKPSNIGYIFDSQFSQVKIGDTLRINYGNGVSTQFAIESIRYSPGVEWVVRVNGSNLFQAADGLVDGLPGNAYARIDRPQVDDTTYGVLALAAANAVPYNLYSDILGSVIVGHPRGATALGLGFDPNQLNSSHYKLWLELYPTGNPTQKVISLPFIDITGNQGSTPGSYTLEKIVHATNNAFRTIGYNYRFIAFEYNNNFGIMLADCINNASFAIIKGSNSTGFVSTGTYNKNVVADVVDGDGFDPLGFGQSGSDLASPAYQTTFIGTSAAQFPTKVISPAKNRFYFVNGRKLDYFKPTYFANNDGYWPATIHSYTSNGSSVEVTYKVNLCLKAAKLKSGKTLVVQPNISLNDPKYSKNDYGRFIIKQVSFQSSCDDDSYTLITVINGVHGTGNGISLVSDPGLDVKIYFSEDSVGFNDSHLINSTVTGINYHRFHEIYINSEGATFSHERARMKADQAEVAAPVSLLRTDFWHIKNVSPKLRGYRDNGTTHNKYIRFYILRYDASTGEYDGYIGKRNTANASITTTGPLTTSKKGCIARFYDETYVDFIDLQFEELNPGPTGTAILSDSTPRYVDIEIFPSLQSNKENFLLGSCEVNWNPPANQYIIQAVKDLREFGTIGIAELNDSATNYITALSREVQENGIVRGFEYVSSNISTGELFFTGGVASVNGRIVTANNSSVTIPEISEYGTLGVTVKWAICVNEFGYLKPILLTSSKQQYFASSQLYYIESSTFEELIYRKDVAVISLVDAHIASITINDSDVSDARRFVANQGYNFPLVLESNNFLGNFHSLDVVKTWLLHLNGRKNIVKISGNFTITSALDFTELTSKVIFEGDGAVFNITSAQGIIVGSNIILRNIKFIYNPNGTYLATSYTNSLNGCIYNLTSNDCSNISIENCEFVSQLVTNGRPPFINFLISNGCTLSNVTIEKNTFNDGDATKNQAAIMISANLSGEAELPAVTRDIFVEKNTCNENQGIYVTTFTSNKLLSGYGLSAANVHITDNSCGNIGILTGLNKITSVNANQTNMVYVKNNRCKLIGSLEGTWGVFPKLTTTPPYGIGNFTVDGNTCHWIHLIGQDLISSNQYVDGKIINNSLTASDYEYLTPLLVSASSTGLADEGFNQNSAIRLMSSSGVSHTHAIFVSHNTIMSGESNNNIWNYVGAAIKAENSAIISSNLIRGLSDVITTDNFTYLTSGISLGRGYQAGGTRSFTIQHNRIYRGTATLDKYIKFVKNNSFTYNDTAIIVDNFFDSPTVDGTVITLTDFLPNGWIYERNKNQTNTLYFAAYDGTWTSGAEDKNLLVGDTSLELTTLTAGIAVYGNDTGLTTVQFTGDNDAFVRCSISLSNYLPPGTYVTLAQATIDTDDTASTPPIWTLKLGNLDQSAPINAMDGINPAIELAPTPFQFISGFSYKIILGLAATFHSGGGNVGEYNVNHLLVQYRW